MNNAKLDDMTVRLLSKHNPQKLEELQVKAAEHTDKIQKALSVSDDVTSSLTKSHTLGELQKLANAVDKMDDKDVLAAFLSGQPLVKAKSKEVDVSTSIEAIIRRHALKVVGKQ